MKNDRLDSIRERLKLREGSLFKEHLINKKKLSIKWQLMGYLVTFVVILLVVLWLLQVVFLNDFYSAVKVNEIKSIGNRIAKVSDKVQNYNTQKLIESIASSNELCVVLAREDGTIIYAEDKLVNNAIYPMSYTDYSYFVKKAKEAGGIRVERRPYSDLSIERSFGQNYFKTNAKMRKLQSVVYTRVLSSDLYGNFVLLINGVISPIDATVQTIRKQLLYVTLIMLIMALILTFLISRKIASPIVKINEDAKSLARNYEGITFNGTGYKEIAELSNTLSYAAMELTKTERFRKELIANVSHDLRTPLTLIGGYAEIMRDLPGENTPENIQVIIDEARRLTQLVNDMLDLSKLQSGTTQIEVNEFNLTESIQTILKRYVVLTEQEGYQIGFEYDEEVRVKADELKLSQVLYNLINNAINYTGEDKVVTVKQKVENDVVRIEVVDTGNGIDKENLPYIWERYYKVDKTHKRAAIGTGLGLSIVRNVLECHGAKYGVISPESGGTTFWFELKRL